MKPLLRAALLLAACRSPGAPLEAEPPATPALQPAVDEAPSVPSTKIGATSANKQVILGDPLGLLSRPPELIAPHQGPASLTTLHKPEPRVIERDPRALERTRRMPLASREIHEASASRVISDLRRSSAKLRVLFLYAAYCPACRSVMPNVRDAAKHHYGRGVEFTAASVDRNRAQYADYVPNLQGVFPATLVTAESGAMTRELKQLGVPLEGSGFAIPLIAVLDRKQNLIAYGNTGLAERLDEALTSLEAP